MEKIIYTVFYVAVAATGILLGIEYRNRIHRLKENRQAIMQDITGIGEIYQDRDKNIVSEISMLFYVLIFLSLIEIILTWFAKY